MLIRDIHSFLIVVAIRNSLPAAAVFCFIKRVQEIKLLRRKQAIAVTSDTTNSSGHSVFYTLKRIQIFVRHAKNPAGLNAATISEDKYYSDDIYCHFCVVAFNATLVIFSRLMWRHLSTVH